MSGEPTVRDLYIGRVGYDIPLYEVSQWTNSGGQTQITGRIGFTSPANKVADAITARQQLLDLLDNPDEPAVPLRYAPDPTLDGYYVVDDVKVSLDASSESPYDEGRWRFEIALTPFATAAAPIAEITVQGSLRSGDLAALTAGYPVVAFPSTATEPFIDAITGAYVVASRTSEDGAITIGLGSLPGPLIFRARAGITPAAWYTAACKIEHGSPLRQVIGRRVSPAPATWRISNGLVRVSGSLTALTVSAFDGSTWDPISWTIATNSGTFPLGPITAVVVLRNSPECVSVRLVAATSPVVGSAFPGRCYVDLTLYAGDRLLYGSLTSDTSFNWSVKRSTAEAGTTFGVIAQTATSTDAQGNRYQAMTYATHTNDGTQGGFSVTAKFQFDFALTAIVNFATAPVQDGQSSLITQYSWAGSQIRRLAAR